MPVFDDVGTFHRFARAYDLLMPAADPDALWAGLARADREVRRVLDVGGGTGRGVRAVGVPEPVVVDAARGMVRATRRRGLPAVQGDATRLPVGSGSVDAVLIVDALHHFPDRAAAIREAARALAPGGVLVVRDFDPGTVRGRALVAAEGLVGFDSTFEAPDDLAATVAGAGLDPAVTERGFGYTVVGVAPADVGGTGREGEPAVRNDEGGSTGRAEGGRRESESERAKLDDRQRGV